MQIKFNNRLNKFFIYYGFNLRSIIINDFYYNLILYFMNTVIDTLNKELALIVRSDYLK
jgi:hypothetical protein